MRPGRTTLDFADLGWSDRLFVGRYHQVRASPGLPDHAHGGRFEICWLRSGVQVYAVGGRSHVLRGGDCFVTRPDEVHSSAGTPQERGTLYWMQVRPPCTDGDFLGLPAVMVDGLFRRLSALPRTFPGPPAIQAGFDAVLAAWSVAAADERAVRIAIAVAQTLFAVADAGAATPPARRAGGLERVLARIDQALPRPLPLAELAAAAGLSLPRFKVVFRNALGIPPAEYVLRRRLDRAIATVAGGASVLDAALDAGFASSQHFATVCRRYTGRTPRQYRR